MMFMEAQVKKQIDIRPGKGFSLSEIQKSGLTVLQARKLGLYVDPRRKTLHEFNVKALEVFIKERQKQLEEVVVEEPVKEEKKRKKEKKKEKKVEEKPKEKKLKKVKPEKEEKITTDVTEIKGVGKKKAEELKAAGISTVGDLIKADTEELAAATSFTAEYIEKLKEKAEAL